MRRLVLGLNAATVLLVVGGIMLLVIPSPGPAARVPAVVSLSAGSTEDVRPPVVDVGAGERVVRSNIFSARRAAPPRRYSFGDPTEPDAMGDVGVSVAADGVASDSAVASTTTDAVPHLYGTMLGTEATALLRLDVRASEPKLYRVGDRAGDYRVVEIAERVVTLIGPNGRVVLRLPRPEQ